MCVSVVSNAHPFHDDRVARNTHDTDRHTFRDASTRTGQLRLEPGEVAHLVFCSGPAPVIPHLEPWVEQRLHSTRSFWRRWVGQMLYRGPWREVVERSALTLKLMTFQPTGAIIASPTTSLPEEIGGGRNWDYRFRWIRDSAIVLNALFLLGFRDEAAAYMRWLGMATGSGCKRGQATQNRHTHGTARGNAGVTGSGNGGVHALRIPFLAA